MKTMQQSLLLLSHLDALFTKMKGPSIAALSDNYYMVLLGGGGESLGVFTRPTFSLFRCRLMLHPQSGLFIAAKIALDCISVPVSCCFIKTWYFFVFSGRFSEFLNFLLCLNRGVHLLNGLKFLFIVLALKRMKWEFLNYCQRLPSLFGEKDF